jgi:hypothetical protein
MSEKATTKQDFTPQTETEQEAADLAVFKVRKDQLARNLLADLSDRERLLVDNAFALGAHNRDCLRWDGSDDRLLMIARQVAEALEAGYLLPTP